MATKKKEIIAKEGRADAPFRLFGSIEYQDVILGGSHTARIRPMKASELALYEAADRAFIRSQDWNGAALRAGVELSGGMEVYSKIQPHLIFAPEAVEKQQAVYKKIILACMESINGMEYDYDALTCEAVVFIINKIYEMSTLTPEEEEAL